MNTATIETSTLIKKRRDKQVPGSVAAAVSSVPAASGGSGTIGDILAALLSVDGAGSGLDADLLDGREGSYYAPLDSPTFTGVHTINGTANEFVTITDTDNGTKYLLNVGGIGNGKIKVRHIDGKDFDTADLDTLFFQHETGYGIVMCYGGGNIGVGFLSALARVAINGGLHVGGESDPGDNNLLVDGNVAVTWGDKWNWMDYDNDYRQGIFHDAVNRVLKIFSTANDGGTHGEIEFYTRLGAGSSAADIGIARLRITNVGNLREPNFTSGWGGSNWQIAAAGDAEFENLIVRGSARFRELIIDQLSIISGSQLLSSARGKVLSVDTVNSRVTLEDPNSRGSSSFAVNDFFWIKNVDIDKNLFTDCRGQISAITGVVLTLDFSVTGANGAITDVAAGDIIVQRGHPTTTARQNLIYKTVTDANAPYERYMTGIDSLGAFDDLDNVAAQIGDLTSLASHDIVPATPGIGLYTNNAYLSGIMKSNIVSVEGVSSNIKISGPDIWENAANESSDIHINRLGYNGGNTQFRGTHIYNGKGDRIASFWGQYGGYELYTELKGHVFITGALQFAGNDSLSYVYEKAPSNNIRNSHDAEVAIESDVYYKVKTITLTKGLKGSVRINFSMKWVDNGGNGTTAYGRLYRNDNVGVLQALGTEQSTTSPAYVLITQDITQQWNPGDKLELWIHTNDDMNQDQVVVNNLRILYDNDPIVAVPSTNS